MSRGLTGGTGDVNPQWFVTTFKSLGTTYGDASTPMPIQRLPSRGRSQVMEILKVQFYNLNLISAPLHIVAGTDAACRFYLTTKSNGTTEPTGQTGAVICSKSLSVASVAASTASIDWAFEDFIDLTDGAGHGILVATDTIFVGCIQTNANSPFTAGGAIAARIFYRMKDVGIQEYIGIVQSQT